MHTLYTKSLFYNNSNQKTIKEEKAQTAFKEAMKYAVYGFDKKINAQNTPIEKYEMALEQINCKMYGDTLYGGIFAAPTSNRSRRDYPDSGVQADSYYRELHYCQEALENLQKAVKELKE